MIRRSIPDWLFWLLMMGGLAIAALGYGYLSHQQTSKNPSQTIVPGWKAFAEGIQRITAPSGLASNPKPSMLRTDLMATYWRLLVGLSTGVVASVLVGIGMGAYRWIEAPLSPIISFLSKIPPTAMMPIYFILVGTDQRMFTAMVALGVFFTMAQSIYQAVQKDVSDDAINKAYTLGASDFEILYEVIWKQILPRVIENIRLQIGPAMIFLLAAEMIVGDQGIGYRIRMESRILNLNVVYLYLAILGMTGLVLEWMLLFVRRKVCPWFGA
jgi:ABC-type nitrate/sulfonate/bicarbonate transport system permease component